MTKGKGYNNRNLSEEEARSIIIDAFSETDFKNKKVLVILPDNTRSGPTDYFFKQFCDVLGSETEKLDFLIALGTHPLLSDEKIQDLLKISSDELKNKYCKSRIFNHRWDLPESFTTLGKLSKDTIHEISEGLFNEEVIVAINKMVLEYDILIIYGPVFPHEVVGFSGGNKYLFPGIAGVEIINFFHWLGAVITNVKINGNKLTPTRRVIDKAASLLKVPCICFCSVISEKKLRGLFAGDPREAWSRAADLSAQVNIVHKKKTFKKVLGIAPEMYDDIWTAGKVMYKLEPIIEEGGTLIIYAPHITEVSYTHGKILDKIGYHVRDYFTKQMDKFADIPGGVMAHSTHVKGLGAFENGMEKPRVNLILATGITEERCRKINLGYMNPDDIKVEEWEGREQEGVLLVRNAGEILYKLEGEM